MLADAFDYTLPHRLIAQTPASRRDASRLMVLDRTTGTLKHEYFPNILRYLKPGDLLVLNDSKVIRARLRGVKGRTGAKMEMLLLEELKTNDWWVMLKPAKRLQTGDSIQLNAVDGSLTGVQARLVEKNSEGHCRLVFSGTNDIRKELDRLGEIPLPPYIERQDGPPNRPDDLERYQTVYAAREGSVAAPTAGLHFTQTLLDNLTSKGIGIAKVTLHVGLGTFAPVKVEDVDQHIMHEESFEVSPETAAAVNKARAENLRVIAVGTTSVRVLESAPLSPAGQIEAGRGKTRIFIRPPAKFKHVDSLITNFHLPKSTLLMLVSAFASPGRETGRAMILGAYREAIAREYRFFSYGDAMLIL